MIRTASLALTLALLACNEAHTNGDGSTSSSEATTRAESSGTVSIGGSTGDLPADTSTADTSSTGAASDVEISVLFERVAADGADHVVVVAIVFDAGAPASGADVSIVGDGTAADVVEQEPGVYRAELVPASQRTLLPVQVSMGDVTVERTALVLVDIDERWGQPELVPGLVNTPAYEDSSDISPDGEWLIVSNYSPIDLLGCLIAQDPDVPDSSLPPCNDVLGPIDAPERPDLAGRERVLSPTEILHAIPRLGITQEIIGNAPLPPVGGYGFRRQPDGTFAEPFAIAYDAHGITGAPFGFDFVGAPDGDDVQVVFAWLDPSAPATDGDLITATLELGVVNDLGALTGTFPDLALEPPAVRLQQPSFDDLQSNPCVVADGVYFDQHDASDREFDILYYPGAIDGPLGPQGTVALSQPDRAEYQPHEHDGRLYFVTEFERMLSAERKGGGDPTDPATWGAERVELSIASAAFEGTVVSLGEPSLGTHDGTTWMYFIYGTADGTSFDAGVARVPLRK